MEREAECVACCEEVGTGVDVNGYVVLWLGAQKGKEGVEGGGEEDRFGGSWNW